MPGVNNSQQQSVQARFKQGELNFRSDLWLKNRVKWKVYQMVARSAMMCTKTQEAELKWQN